MRIEDAWEQAICKEGLWGNYRQTIDDDQAVDGNGKAAYEHYCFHIGGKRYYYTADEMERFAATW